MCLNSSCDLPLTSWLCKVCNNVNIIMLTSDRLSLSLSSYPSKLLSAHALFSSETRVFHRRVKVGCRVVFWLPPTLSVIMMMTTRKAIRFNQLADGKTFFFSNTYTSICHPLVIKSAASTSLVLEAIYQQCFNMNVVRLASICTHTHTQRSPGARALIFRFVIVFLLLLLI